MPDNESAPVQRKAAPKPATSQPVDTTGFAALTQGATITPFAFGTRSVRPRDIAMRVLFCGVCHTDLHSVEKWGQEFPLLPGHEIIGEVTEIGAAVSGFSVGDKVAVGTIVDSCRVCEPCVAHMESYCRAFPTLTYDGIDRVDGSRTRGGYATRYVSDERFVYHVPPNLDLASAAPLLCAGITTYSPLRHWNAGPGKTIGVIGIGGLGHLAIKFARAMGAHVVAFTTSAAKAGDARNLGAHEVVLSTDEAAMKAQAFRIDLIIDTVSATYPMSPYLLTLKMDGTLCSLGIPDAFDLQPILLTMGRRSISSSGVGGTAETNEMLRFCADNNIAADVELIKPSEINKAFARLAKSDVRYRFVLDMQ